MLSIRGFRRWLIKNDACTASRKFTRGMNAETAWRMIKNPKWLAWWMWKVYGGYNFREMLTTAGIKDWALDALDDALDTYPLGKFDEEPIDDAATCDHIRRVFAMPVEKQQ